MCTDLGLFCLSTLIIRKIYIFQCTYVPVYLFFPFASLLAHTAGYPLVANASSTRVEWSKQQWSIWMTRRYWAFFYWSVVVEGIGCCRSQAYALSLSCSYSLGLARLVHIFFWATTWTIQVSRASMTMACCQLPNFPRIYFVNCNHHARLAFRNRDSVGGRPSTRREWHRYPDMRTYAVVLRRQQHRCHDIRIYTPSYWEVWGGLPSSRWCFPVDREVQGQLSFVSHWYCFGLIYSVLPTVAQVGSNMNGSSSVAVIIGHLLSLFSYLIATVARSSRLWLIPSSFYVLMFKRWRLVPGSPGKNRHRRMFMAGTVLRNGPPWRYAFILC